MITGRGKHSAKGKAVIQPRILRIIRDNRLKAYNDVSKGGKVNPGAFIIKIR